MEYINCVHRGTNDINDAVANLDETSVQLFLVKFLLGGGTFKRTKYLYVIYTGPKCNMLKRGRCVEKISKFVSEHLKGVTGLTTTDRSSLSFESLVSQFREIFTVDDGEFSIDKICKEHLNRLEDEKTKMYQEQEHERKSARLKAIQAQIARRSKKEKAAFEKGIDQDDNDPTNIANKVLNAIRNEKNIVNWAVFSPDPVTLQTVAYGCGGIFELIKNLPNDKWLFGLFNISFNSQEEERCLIFFQWIGNKAKIVRDRGSSAIYPAMSKLLSPYSREIYIVGQVDLVPSVIINKCKNAFSGKKNELENKRPQPTNLLLDEKSYTEALLADQDHHLYDYDGVKTPEKTADFEPISMNSREMSMTTLSDSLDSSTELYNSEDTLRLIMSSEGGLIWAIFKVE
ncbi:unnamed protein product [Phytomonas sp. Hart1]|nr:unnamed protein product [Phytomonas sp. Hart1]|eukprot:CCW68117.1 unnamed protein product [Phytomonas sp. isolate Hart1]